MDLVRPYHCVNKNPQSNNHNQIRTLGWYALLQIATANKGACRPLERNLEKVMGKLQAN